ncbi:hypothetical protein TcWFU_003646 [Taenia crassiceps]|uniref:Uncharacterized protein n=1 Tax=Taenia crassiceps TaxID=6207 RepID=A0ABR4Q680_9CEST
MSQNGDKPGSASRISDPAPSPSNPLQSLSIEKRQILTNLLFLLTAQHRQQKLANRQIEKASSSQQYPPVRSEFDCRPFKGPKTPPTPTQPPLPPSPPSSSSPPQQDYTSYPIHGTGSHLGQNRHFYRPIASSGRRRSFRELLESRRRPLRPQTRRDFSNDPVMSRLQMRSVVNVVVGRRGEPQRHWSSSTARSSCSCPDCEKGKQRWGKEDEEDSCARTRPYQGKVRYRDPVVIERHVEGVDSWQLERKRRREWIPQETYRRQLPWQRRRQVSVSGQTWELGRHGRFVDSRTAGRRGRQDGRARERGWDRGWRGDFY